MSRFLDRIARWSDRQPSHGNKARAMFRATLVGATLLAINGTVVVAIAYLYEYHKASAGSYDIGRNAYGVLVTGLLSFIVGLIGSLINSVIVLGLIKTIIIRQHSSVLVALIGGAILPTIINPPLFGHSVLYILFGAITGLVVWQNVTLAGSGVIEIDPA